MTYGMGCVGGWNPARAQAGSWRGDIEDEQFLAAGCAGFPAGVEEQPAAITIVSNISAMYRRTKTSVRLWALQADWCQRRRSAHRRPRSTWPRRRIRTDSLEASASRPQSR